MAFDFAAHQRENTEIAGWVKCLPPGAARRIRERVGWSPEKVAKMSNDGCCVPKVTDWTVVRWEAGRFGQVDDKPLAMYGRALMLMEDYWSTRYLWACADSIAKVA